LDRAEHHLHRYGEGKAIVLARFIPIIRTVLNPVAGALEVPARRFLVWNVIGGVIWTEVVLLTGHFLGQQLGQTFNIDKYIIPAVVLIVLLSFIPILLELRKVRREAGAGNAPGAGASGGQDRLRGAHRVRNGSNTP
jgi:membrane-associated protein